MRLPEKKNYSEKRTHSNIYKNLFTWILTTTAICVLTCGCGSKPKSFEIPTEKGTRDSTPVCLTPERPGIQVFSGDGYLIDYSNASEGYISACYTGSCPKNKFQITQPDGTTYTYNLKPEMEDFPLSSDSGTYQVGIFEIQHKDIADMIRKSNFKIQYNQKTIDELLEESQLKNFDLDILNNICQNTNMS